MKRLLEIQQKLKAPKGQFNSFGNYKYRSCEDIVEAVKPLLAEQKLVLNLSDDIHEVGGRIYVQAVATLFDESGKQIAYSVGFAREEESKKGMDSSQITGSCSSYARKYALNWLFAIDDWVDSDSTNKGEVKEVKKKEEKDITKEWPFVDKNELPWFNKPDMEKLRWEVEWVKEKQSSDELIKAIETKFRVSKAMKQEIADFRASL